MNENVHDIIEGAIDAGISDDQVEQLRKAEQGMKFNEEGVLINSDEVAANYVPATVNGRDGKPQKSNHLLPLLVDYRGVFFPNSTNESSL